MRIASRLANIFAILCASVVGNSRTKDFSLQRRREYGVWHVNDDDGIVLEDSGSAGAHAIVDGLDLRMWMPGKTISMSPEKKAG